MSIAKYDLEDSLKANFTNPFDMLSKSEDIYNRILDELNSRRDKNDEEYTVEEIKDILYSTFGGLSKVLMN